MRITPVLKFDRTSLAAVFTALLIAGANAGAASFVVPSQYTEAEDPIGYNGFFNTVPGLRMQEVYSAAHFPDHTIRITEFRWRRDAFDTTPLTGTLESLRIRLSTTTRAPDALGMVFAENEGPDAVTVFDGAAPFSSVTLPKPGVLTPFEIAVRLTHPFRYDPSQGNLLVDMSNAVPFPGLNVDAASGGGDQSSRILSDSDAAGTVARYVDSGADVMEIVYDPDLPAEPFTLKVTADATQLWPPNGQRVPVTLTAVGQTADGQLWPHVESRITSVTCNEVYGKAARDKRNPQWIITDDLSVSLVAKKLPGRMHMRVYTITVQADGLDGYVGTGQIQVVVPSAAPRSRR